MDGRRRSGGARDGVCAFGTDARAVPEFFLYLTRSSIETQPYPTTSSPTIFYVPTNSRLESPSLILDRENILPGNPFAIAAV